MARTASVHRKTRETEISVQVALDGTGVAAIRTGVGFFDHMLTLLAGHSLFDLAINAVGDLDVDSHHTVEDVGICLGRAMDQALANRAGIARYGWCVLPMDESQVTTAVDLGGRAGLEWQVPVPQAKIGNFDAELAEEFWRAVTANGRFNLHAHLNHGLNSHHILEAAFKSAARSLRQAVSIDPRLGGAIPSTKGVLVDGN